MEGVQNDLRSPGTLTDMACPRCGSDCSCACSGDPVPAHDWRRQVSLEVRAHKARRRHRLDPDAPLLDFQEEETKDESQVAPVAKKKSWWDHAADAVAEPAPLRASSYQDNQVTLEQAAQEVQESACLPSFTPVEELGGPQCEPYERPPLPPFPRINGPVPKIIEFPRSRHCELAEPVTDQLRIFEAVEELPPPPPSYLAEIEIAPEETPNFVAEEIEVPIQTAAMAQRVYATAVDTAVILVAVVVFGFSAQFFASSLPMTKPLLASAAVCVILLLTVYYVLSLSLSRSTPGMQASGLQVMTFKGGLPSRWRLRWRALATVLSFAALGMGFAWALIDEDRLCWHDRISHTYLASK